MPLSRRCKDLCQVYSAVRSFKVVPLHECLEFWIAFVVPPHARIAWGMLPTRVELSIRWVSVGRVLPPLVPSSMVGWPPPPLVSGHVLCLPSPTGVPLCLAKVTPLGTWPLPNPLWRWSLASPCRCRTPPRDHSPPVVRSGVDLPIPFVGVVGPLDWDGVSNGT